MSSREQHHRPHLFSLSLFLFPPPIFEESLIPRSFSLPTFFRHRWKDETVRCSILYVRLIIRILSLSLSLVNMAKSWRKLDRCVTYVERALQFQGYRFVTPFR